MTTTDTNEYQTEDRLTDCPPSTKLVHLVLEREGPCTQCQLTELTLLSRRTVRKALQHLEERELVSERPCEFDARKRIYRATTTASA